MLGFTKKIVEIPIQLICSCPPNKALSGKNLFELV